MPRRASDASALRAAAVCIAGAAPMMVSRRSTPPPVPERAPAGRVAGSASVVGSADAPRRRQVSSAARAFMAAADLHSEQQRVRGAAKRDQRRALQAARLVAQERRGAERRRRRLIRYLAVALGTASLLVLYAAMDMASRGAVRTVEGGGGVFAVWYGLHDRGAQQRHGLRLDAPGANEDAVMPGLFSRRSPSVVAPLRRTSSLGTTVTVANWSVTIGSVP